MIVRCKICATQIPNKDTYLNSMYAQCRRCDVVFDISDKVLSVGQSGSSGPKSRRKPVPMPPQITVDSPGLQGPALDRGAPYRALQEQPRDSLRITRRWKAPRYRKKIWFGLASLAAATFFLLGDLYLRGGIEGRTTVLLPTLLAIGVYHFIGAYLGYTNRTVITLGPDSLTIKHEPLPWPGNRKLPTKTLKQLYVTSRLIENNLEVYDLQVELHGEERLTMLKGLDNVEQALFIEQEIERRLGIIDVVVEGESPAAGARAE